MKDSRYLYVALIITFIATYATIFYLQSGPVPPLIVCGAMIGGLVIWLRTSFHHPVDPKKILPVYLLTTALFSIHILEEYWNDFSGRISSALHINWSEHDFILLICLGGPLIWILSAAAIYFRNPFGNFIACFVFFGMIVGEPTHMLVFPLVEGGRYHYFPGMWTSLFPMIPAIYGLFIIITEYRAYRRNAGDRHEH